MRAIVNIIEDRDVYANGNDCIDEDCYDDGTVHASMETKNMR